jgi:hypothetical protein
MIDMALPASIVSGRTLHMDLPIVPRDYRLIVRRVEGRSGRDDR